MAVSSFSLVGLILIVVLVILLVLIIKHVGKKALILIPIIVLGAMFLSHTRMQRTAVVSSLYEPDFGVVQDVQKQSAIWNEAIDGYLEADRYASQEDASRFLSYKLCEALTDTHKWKRLLVCGEADTTTRALNVFSDTIRSQLNLDDVQVMSHKPRNLPDDPNLIVCELNVINLKSSHRVVNGLPINTSDGTLQMHVANPAHLMDRAVEFQQKDWLNSLSTLQNQGHSTVMVARSGGSCMDETEAQNQAMAQAAMMVQSLLRKTNQDRSILDQEITVTPLDLGANQIIADQFTQSLRTSTARVWRHAVLLNLQPRQIRSLLQQKTREIQHMHRNWAKDLMSLAGLALVVFILYIFLNAATKGYYVWSLRVIAVVTIAGIVVVLLLM
jgi:hypothetical protein